MTFTSFSFALFVAVMLAVYYLIPKKGQWMLLLVGSYVFYLFAGVQYLGFLVLTTLTTYAATRLMDANLEKQKAYLAENKATLSRDEKKEYKAAVKKKNKVWMILCLVLNFGILAVCKACLIEPFATIAKEGSFSFLALGLPMGISFYMFQSMGYVVDVYRGTAKAEKNFFRLALFVSFFPQLVQGPIHRYCYIRTSHCDCRIYAR